MAEREDTFAVFEEKLRNSQASGKEGIVESNLSRRQKRLQKCDRDLTSQFDMLSSEGFGIGVIFCVTLSHFQCGKGCNTFNPKQIHRFLRN